MKQTSRAKRNVGMIRLAFMEERVMRMLVLLMMLIPAGAAVGQEAAQPQTTEGARMVTLSECIKAALEKNLQIRVESFTPKMSASGIKLAGASFDPVLKSTVQDYSAESKKANVFDSSELNRAQFDFSLAHQLKTSTSYSISFTNQRTETDSTFATAGSYFDSNISVRVTQPILKNFGPQNAQKNLLVARKNRDASEEMFKSAVTGVITQVRQTYWNFVHSMANLDVQKQSLKLAQDLLEQNRVRVQVGTLAPIDILQSEAEVASREEAILVAESALENYEDQLKRLMDLPGAGQDWSTTIRPADKPAFEPMHVAESEMVKTALERRPDLLQLRHDLEAKGINLKYAQNQLLPDLNLYAQVGGTGVAGGYSDAVSDALKFEYPNWAIGFNFTLPIKNDAAEAEHERTVLEEMQAGLRIRNLEQQVYQEVRAAVRQVETNQKRVDATRAALRLAEKKLEAEQKKYSVGLTTNYFVLQFQKDLSIAQTNELQALTDYNLALAELDRVTGMALERSNVVIDSYLQ